MKLTDEESVTMLLAGCIGMGIGALIVLIAVEVLKTWQMM